MWVGLPKLVAAVSNAGGLGILTGLTAGSPENLRQSELEGSWLTRTDARLGKKANGMTADRTCSVSSRHSGSAQDDRQAIVSRPRHH